MPNHYPEHYLPKEKINQDTDLAPFFGYLSQSQDLSEIKPPLAEYLWVQNNFGCAEELGCAVVTRLDAAISSHSVLAD